MAIEKIIETLEDKKNLEKWIKEYEELEKLQKEEMYKILLNDEYINWLVNFFEINPSFSDDDWLYFPDKLSNEDRIKVNKLNLLYFGIEEYCKKNYLYPTLNEYGYYYKINYNDIKFIIGHAIGQGSHFYVKKITDLDECIDFNDILNNKTRDNIESIKIDLKKLSDQVKLICNYGVPSLAIKECVEKTLDEVDENKTLRKTIKL